MKAIKTKILETDKSCNDKVEFLANKTKDHEAALPGLAHPKTSQFSHFGCIKLCLKSCDKQLFFEY